MYVIDNDLKGIVAVYIIIVQQLHFALGPIN